MSIEKVEAFIQQVDYTRVANLVFAIAKVDLKQQAGTFGLTSEEQKDLPLGLIFGLSKDHREAQEVTTTMGSTMPPNIVADCLLSSLLDMQEQGRLAHAGTLTWTPVPQEEAETYAHD